jgi:predicted metal-dependent hydrolase
MSTIHAPDLPTQEQAHWHDADELRWAARHWAVRIGVKIPQVHLRPMTTKWASISTSGRLTLNTALLQLPKTLGEFVIVHELVHLLASNHGRVFKSFMYAYLPDWEEREQRLQAAIEQLPSTYRGVPNLH